MTLARSLIPNFFAQDTVLIFDSNFNQLFRNARPIRAVVKENSKVMEHPVETGAVITDHRIILPIEIELSVVIASSDYQDVYKQVKQIYLNGDLLIVQTYSDVYENMLISDMPHDEDPDFLNSIAIGLRLKQVLLFSLTVQTIPASQSNTNTVNRGTQQPNVPMAAQVPSALSNFKGVFQ